MKHKAFPRTLMSGLLLLACTHGAADEQSVADGAQTSGGYTGLGRYVETSGVYGDGIHSAGGVTTEPTSSGGARNLTKASGGATGADTRSSGGTASVSSGPPLSTAGVSSSSSALGGGGSPQPRSGMGGTAASGITTPASIGGNGAGGLASATGALMGGAPAAGGSSAAGGAMSSVSGGTSPSTGGSSGGPSVFTWPAAYDPAGVPSIVSGKHNPGSNCMASACHASTQVSRAFALGGTVYQSDGITGAANVQIAVVSGAATLTTYSATNGNFWLAAASASNIDWAKATVHLRNAKAEVAKPSGTSVNAACNSCHGSTMRITAP